MTATKPPAANVGLVPVVRIVHVTDLHVRPIGTNPVHGLNAMRRVLSRSALREIERFNLFGWDEGTQGHYPKAPRSFARFLKRWWVQNPKWRGIPTWLIDTGDRTTFGDSTSMDLGEEYLDTWRRALGGCDYLSLYGNHDAWPGTLPAVGPMDGQQKSSIQGRDGWNPDLWLSKPLWIRIPGRRDYVHLYGVDTVCWGAWRNTRAVGNIPKSMLRKVQKEVQSGVSNQGGGLRIFATHHPLAFPWTSKEVRTCGVSTMRLLREKRCAEHFRNDHNVPAVVGPLAHVLISGHTHLQFPATKLDSDVTQIKQRYLSPYQLQLVGGSLMLNKSTAQTNDPSLLRTTPRSTKMFTHRAVDPGTCQAQVLRIYASAADDSLVLMRSKVKSFDCGQTYRELSPDCVVLHY